MADPEPNPTTEAPPEPPERGRMSFFDHLTELRDRIIWSLVSAGVGLVIALFFTERIMKYLVEHIIKVKPVFTTPTEAFWTYMKVAMILGLFISMPAILYQVWKFVAPGLHSHERKYAAPFILVSSVLFLLGGAFAILVVVPFAMQFLVNFGQQQGLQPMISISSSIDFILKFTLAFGLVFELPVVITILSMIGVVTPQFLSRNRKYAILINFVIAAMLTPTPDLFNQILMAAPMCVLYEVGIICARIFGRKRQPKPEAAAASEETPAV
ncbi:MAG TPA: twin-arginine translocase subunit TatC [Methylomirabilota bacterium]|nr:twin-arginine translocase subunit TatC [Methylomirabilota bacterium]